MTDDKPEEMPDETFQAIMGELIEHLGGVMPDEPAKPMREFSPDTLMGDIPDDLTEAESLHLFGTEYDKSTMRLKSIIEMLGPPGRFEYILHHVHHITDPVFKIEDTDTISSVRPKGIIVDIVTVGLLAHEILSNVDFGGSGVIRMSDLLNGKDPFGGDQS